MTDHMFVKKLFIRFAVHVFRERLSICVYASFPFAFEGGMMDLIILVPVHCLSVYFSHSETSDTQFRTPFPTYYCN